MGNGFKVGQLPVADYDTLLLFATGTGIAPVKALIESQDLQACTAPRLLVTAFRQSPPPPPPPPPHLLASGCAVLAPISLWNCCQTIVAHSSISQMSDTPNPPINDFGLRKPQCIISHLIYSSIGFCAVQLNCPAIISVRVPATDRLDSLVCLQLSERASVKLYYGTRTLTTTPFQEAAAGWAAAGVELVNVYSSDNKGYVQVCCGPSTLPAGKLPATFADSWPTVRLPRCQLLMLRLLQLSGCAAGCRRTMIAPAAGHLRKGA